MVGTQWNITGYDAPNQYGDDLFMMAYPDEIKFAKGAAENLANLSICHIISKRVSMYAGIHFN